MTTPDLILTSLVIEIGGERLSVPVERLGFATHVVAPRRWVDAIPALAMVAASDGVLAVPAAIHRDRRGGGDAAVGLALCSQPLARAAVRLAEAGDGMVLVAGKAQWPVASLARRMPLLQLLVDGGMPAPESVTLFAPEDAEACPETVVRVGIDAVGALATLVYTRCEMPE